MPTIHVDGRDYEAPADRDLLSALIDLGINLPYFCWHPALGSVGACRQCAVKLFHGESDTRGRMVMACMTPVSEGMRVAVMDPEVMAFRQRVIEWLMVNHPHDCPVCDEGGECHLQDMTVMTGHVYRRYRGRKRTYRNQNLGPFINHEMNRCIQCYRCLRFYRDFAGGRDFDALGSKDHVYFGRFEEGKLESEFSGNLVEICPTGVFTDKTLKAHFTRKWDMETAPSVCAHCGLGCSIMAGARYGKLRRIYPRFHPEVNRYFICDRGRFGYEFGNDERRLREPWCGRGEQHVISWSEAMRQAQEALGSTRRMLGIGSPRASLEANYALRSLVGEDAFSPGMSAVEQEGVRLAIELLRAGPARAARLAEAEAADAVVIFGTDPTNEAPMLDYAIRQGIQGARRELAHEVGIPDWNEYPLRNQLQERRGKLFIAAVAGIKLEAIAEEVVHAAPPELIALAREVEAAARGGGGEATLAGRMAQALIEAKQPLVVVSADGGAALLRAAAEIANTVSLGREAPCLLAIVVPECNSMGVGLLGGMLLEEALDEVESGEADGLIVLENDLFRRADPERVARALRAARSLIVIDHLPNRTTREAELVLPATMFAETTGTLVNNEGRAQRYYRAFIPEGEPRPSWQILRDLLQTQRAGAAWATPEEALAALAEERPEFAPALEAAPAAGWRDRVGQKVARESHRYSGRAAKEADRSIVEPQPPSDPGTPFAFSMEGSQAEPPAALTPRYWYPGWNSVQALYRSKVEAGRPEEGAPGRRLIEPSGAPREERDAAEQAETLGAGEVWLVPRAAIFGSEELSRLAPGIASVIPPAVARLNPEEAGRLGVAEGDLVRVWAEGEEGAAGFPPEAGKPRSARNDSREGNGGRSKSPEATEASAKREEGVMNHAPTNGSVTLPVKLDAGVAPGVVVMPAGYPETEGVTGISRARIEKAP